MSLMPPELMRMESTIIPSTSYGPFRSVLLDYDGVKRSHDDYFVTTVRPFSSCDSGRSQDLITKSVNRTSFSVRYYSLLRLQEGFP